MIRAVLISFALTGSAVLSGCGFTPMHATSPASAKLADIQVDIKKGSDVIDNQAGFFVGQRLRDRIGTAAAASPYRLEISPIYFRGRLGLTDNDIASRYDITVVARWSLIEVKTGETLDKGTTSSTSTFGAPEGPYGVITADNVGVEQAAKETADKLVLDMARALAVHNK
jgi:LPS-assembly lipoprotein